MKAMQRELLLLHTDRVLTGKLRKVCHRNSWLLRECSGWDDLGDAVRSAPASAIIVVDPYIGVPKGSAPSIELASLLNRYPSMTVVAALGLSVGQLDDVRRLGEWGVSQVIDLDLESSEFEIGFRLLESRGRPLRSLVYSSLPSQTGGAARSILVASVPVVLEGGAGGDLAKVFHITPRTLTRWCRKAGLPPPRHVLAWMRILLAAELLDDPGRSVFEVALSCGYSSDGSLRQALKAFVRMTPTELRQQGAFKCVSERFLNALTRARSDRERYRAKSQT